MQDVQENDHWSDDDEEYKDKIIPFSRSQSSPLNGDEYMQNLDRFLWSRNEHLAKPLSSHSSPLMEKGERTPKSGSFKMRQRSLSIPAIGKNRSAVGRGPILSGAPQR
uniref:Uncharacterized protein n=1 Tax=Rhizophora mucronata TaxID=61149 RepID=A0A2P2PLG6_RHIMU